jgi:hypothetical protein
MAAPVAQEVKEVQPREVGVAIVPLSCIVVADHGTGRVICEKEKQE